MAWILGGLMGLEPTTTRITIWANDPAPARDGGEFVGTIQRFRPTVSCGLPGCRSHHFAQEIAPSQPKGRPGARCARGNVARWG